MILLVFVLLALLDLGWSSFLSALNYRSVLRHGEQVPKELKESVSKEEARKAADYSKAKMRLAFLVSPLSTLILLALVVLGFFGLLDSWVGSLHWSAYWTGALFLGILIVARTILSIPVELYDTFVLERRFGFNTTTASTWILDQLKGLALTAVLGLPLLFLLYVFIDGTGPFWWLWAAAIFSVIELLLSLIFPLVIAPLFNKFSPLPEGSLKTGIEALASKCSFRVSGIFIMDGSKRSKHSNAYFTGLGASKRIVLYDTLVSSMSEDEILAVLAHEIGHEKRKHVLKMTSVSILLSFFGFWILALLMQWPELYAAFGFAAASRHAILLILSIVSGPATFFLTPIFSAWSRAHEYQADAYSVGNALASPKEGARSLSSALVKLGRENASNLWPARLYSLWYYSHPTLMERLAAIDKAGSGQPR